MVIVKYSIGGTSKSGHYFPKSVLTEMGPMLESSDNGSRLKFVG